MAHGARARCALKHAFGPAPRLRQPRGLGRAVSGVRARHLTARHLTARHLEKKGLMTAYQEQRSASTMTGTIMRAPYLTAPNASRRGMVCGTYGSR
jgi:hypothetical protein